MGIIVSFPPPCAIATREAPLTTEVLFVGVAVGDRIAAPTPDGAVDGATVIARGPSPRQVLVRFDRGEARWIHVCTIIAVRRGGHVGRAVA